MIDSSVVIFNISMLTGDWTWTDDIHISKNGRHEKMHSRNMELITSKVTFGEQQINAF